MLQVADLFGPFGGMERFIDEFTMRLAQRGDETVLTVADYDGPRDRDGKPNRMFGSSAVPMETVKLDRSEENWLSFAEAYRPDLIVWHAGPETASFVTALSKVAPVAATVHAPVCPAGTRLFRDRDEICLHPSGPACLLRWYTRRCGTHPEPWTALEAMGRANRMLRTLRECDRIYTVSDSLSRFIALEGIDSRLIRVFDNTLGAGSFGPDAGCAAGNASFSGMPPLVTPGDDQELRLLFVGRVNYGKGVQYLLRAIRHLLDRGRSVYGTIVGDGWYMEKLRKLSRELGIEGRVQFVGQTPGAEMDAVYDNADIVVVPSVWPEPAGLVVPEARKRGKPVVVFDAGGLSEWQSFMDGVYIARHGDAHKLADAIVEAAAGRSATPKKQRDHSPPSVAAVKASERIDLIEDLHRVQPFIRKEAASK